MTTKKKVNEDIGSKGHKLAIHKPRFSHNLSIDNSVPFKAIPVSDSSVLQESVHIAVQSIPDTLHIYDIYINIQGSIKEPKNHLPPMYQGKADCALE